MPDDEGMALYEAALQAAPLGPVLEVGSYCGKSTLYLAAGVLEAAADTVVFSVDHHRGSEEHQPGEKYHDPRLVDESGRVHTLSVFRNTIEQAGVGDVVVAIVGASELVAKAWATPLAMVFIDGGHSMEAAQRDLDGWSHHVVSRGLLAIHDVFPDPAMGGRPPYEIYRQALESGRFREVSERRSLRVLQRV